MRGEPSVRGAVAGETHLRGAPGGSMGLGLGLGLGFVRVRARVIVRGLGVVLGG